MQQTRARPGSVLADSWRATPGATVGLSRFGAGARILCVLVALGAASAEPGLAQTTYEFDLVRAKFTVIGFFGGINLVDATGPATVQVTFETAVGAADDDDSDMLDEVVIEMVSLSLDGFSASVGAVPVALWSGAQSLGQIEEQTNGIPGTLDLLPFAPGGAADSYFDLYLTATVFGIAGHNEQPARVVTPISEWPPPAGEIYMATFDPPIPLLDVNGSPLGFSALQYAELELVPTGDWGDAPDPVAATPGEYPTLAASNGAAHDGDGTLRLGTLWDRELDGQPLADASGDGADDDGVVFTSPLVLDMLPQQAGVEVTASQAGLLDAWVDWNIDGDWADAGEQVFSSQAVAAGSNALAITIPTGAVLGCTFSRFRLSTAGGLSSDGIAADGEVEDYRVGLVAVADIDLSDQILAGVQTFTAGNSISAGDEFASSPDLIIADGAQITFHGNVVALKNGVLVEDNGQLTILDGTTPPGCPP
jgi:hypothetical protein